MVAALRDGIPAPAMTLGELERGASRESRVEEALVIAGSCAETGLATFHAAAGSIPRRARIGMR
jgi:hypothetical protein